MPEHGTKKGMLMDGEGKPIVREKDLKVYMDKRELGFALLQGFCGGVLIARPEIFGSDWAVVVSTILLGLSIASGVRVIRDRTTKERAKRMKEGVASVDYK
jgi:hypothetical protein